MVVSEAGKVFCFGFFLKRDYHLQLTICFLLQTLYSGVGGLNQNTELLVDTRV